MYVCIYIYIYIYIQKEQERGIWISIQIVKLIVIMKRFKWHWTSNVLKSDFNQWSEFGFIVALSLILSTVEYIFFVYDIHFIYIYIMNITKKDEGTKLRILPHAYALRNPLLPLPIYGYVFTKLRWHVYVVTQGQFFYGCVQIVWIPIFFFSLIGHCNKAKELKIDSCLFFGY